MISVTKKTQKRAAIIPLGMGLAAISLRALTAMGSQSTNIGGAIDKSVVELQVLVEMLLLGWVDPKTGEHRYFKRDSREERAAQYAVAYLLRNPKPLEDRIRHLLAAVFDPSSIYARSLTLGFRREGRPDARLKHRRIAAEMRRMVRAGEIVEAAIETAAAKYDISERMARKIWARYGKPMLN